MLGRQDEHHLVAILVDCQHILSLLEENMKKLLPLASLLVLASLVLAACGGGTEAPAMTEAPAATEAPAGTEAPAATEAPAGGDLLADIMERGFYGSELRTPVLPQYRREPPGRYKVPL